MDIRHSDAVKIQENPYSQCMRKKYVYDLSTRIMHAGIGLCTLLLLATAGLAHVFYESGPLRHNFWLIHVFFGNLLLVFLVFRFVYLFTGPKYSRLSNFIKLNEWRQLLSFKGRPNWSWGHHPMASLFYLAVYAALFLLSVTGLFLTRIQFDKGFVPKEFYDDLTWFTELLAAHETLAWFVSGFTLLHISALIYHQLKDKLPVFESMKTGFQYRHENQGEKSHEKPAMENISAADSAYH